MATCNYKLRTYYQNETNKLVRQHQKETTVPVRTCISTTRWTNTSTNCTKTYASNNRMRKLRGGQQKPWRKNLEKDLDDLRLHLQENLTALTQDRSVWRKRCKQTLRWFLHRKWRHQPRRRMIINRIAFMLLWSMCMYTSSILIDSIRL